MSWSVSLSSRQPYGLARVCQIRRVAQASVYRHRKPQSDRQRRGPIGPLPDLVLTAEIRAVLATSPFQGEDNQKAWSRHLLVVVRAERIKASVGALIEIL